MCLKHFLVLVLFIFIFNINQVFAVSNLYFSNPPLNVEVGDRVTVFVRIKATEEPINAISGVISFSDNILNAVSLTKDGSIINLWTGEPKISRNKVSFEGVVLNPGFSGNNGLVLKITFEAKANGTANIRFIEGATLASDGLGSNILATLGAVNLKVSPRSATDNTYLPIAEGEKTITKKLAKLPVITDYVENVNTKEKVVLSGKGEPNTLTKIIFKDVSVKSLGEELLSRLQTKKKKLDQVLVKNDNEGNFKYISGNDLVAGVYNATPFLVDEDANVEKPGLGVQLFVSDSKIVKNLIVFINVLGLFIPIVVLCVIIYFIPWYSWLKMKVLKKKIGLEEEELELSGINMARKENLLTNQTEKKNDEPKNN